jgi:inorganic pyrophosphatase
VNNLGDLEKYLGKTVKIIVDRPLGSAHPVYGFTYPLNYGYIPGTLEADGEETDAYIIDISNPVKEYVGVVVAVIKRKNDIEDKLVVAKKTSKTYNKEEIRKLTDFQEKYFDIEIIQSK